MYRLILLMISYFFIACLVLILNSSCNSKSNQPAKNVSGKDTVIIHDTINDVDRYDWQQGFGLTHDPDVDSVWFKPVNYYLNKPECSGLAIDFYYGFLRPSDNGTTDELLKLAVTNNKDLRPFYRWCLNKTIQVSDGALAEHIGEPARRYAEKFPAEFLKYMDEDTSRKRYNQWVDAIMYSGYYENEDYRDKLSIRKNMRKVIESNCSGCDSHTLTRLEKFINHCFN